MKYSDTPAGKVNWGIGDHPRYTSLPYLQDAIWDNTKKLPPDVMVTLMAKYDLTDMNHLVFISVENTINFDNDIHQYLKIGVLP